LHPAICMLRVDDTSDSGDAGEEIIWGISAAWNMFLNTGLLGAISTEIVVSIAWELVASPSF
jgi:hypothetical protein